MQASQSSERGLARPPGDPVWGRLYALNRQRIADRQLSAALAEERRRREEDAVVARRAARHSHPPVTAREADAFFDRQLEWREDSEARSRAEWRQGELEGLREKRDPVIAANSRELAVRGGHRGPVGDWYKRAAWHSLARQGFAVKGGRVVCLDGTPSPPPRRLSPQQLRASVDRQHESELERRRRSLQSLIAELDSEAAAAREGSPQSHFHPHTTPYNSSSNGGTRAIARTDQQAGRDLYDNAVALREKRRAAAAAYAEAREADRPSFSPVLSRRSRSMSLPRRQPLYPAAAPQFPLSSSSAASVIGGRGLSATELEAFLARSERVVRRRASRVEAAQWAAVQQELGECTFRPAISRLRRCGEGGLPSPASSQLRARSRPPPTQLSTPRRLPPATEIAPQQQQHLPVRSPPVRAVSLTASPAQSRPQRAHRPSSPQRLVPQAAVVSGAVNRSYHQVPARTGPDLVAFQAHMNVLLGEMLRLD